MLSIYTFITTLLKFTEPVPAFNYTPVIKINHKTQFFKPVCYMQRVPELNE